MENEIEENELEESRKSISLLLGYKVLIMMNCFALFMLLSIGCFVLVADTQLLADESFLNTWLKWVCAVIIVIVCFVATLSVYVIIGGLSKQGTEHKICRGINSTYHYSGPICTALFVVLYTYTLSMAAYWPIICTVALLIFATISFLPLLAIRWVKDEVRLKYFMDAMARTCTCMTFIGGCLVFLIKNFLVVS